MKFHGARFVAAAVSPFRYATASKWLGVLDNCAVISLRLINFRLYCANALHSLSLYSKRSQLQNF